MRTLVVISPARTCARRALANITAYNAAKEALQVSVVDTARGAAKYLSTQDQTHLVLAATALAKEKAAMQLSINGQADSAKLRALLAPYAGGKCPVAIHYRNAQGECDIRLPDEYRVKVSAPLLDSGFSARPGGIGISANGRI